MKYCIGKFFAYITYFLMFILVGWYMLGFLTWTFYWLPMILINLILQYGG